MLTWEAVDGAERYTIYASTSENGKYTILLTTEKLNFIHTDAEEGKTYYYKMRALAKDNSVVNSSYSKAYTME